jgi:hypothetical protein
MWVIHKLTYLLSIGEVIGNEMRYNQELRRMTEEEVATHFLQRLRKK